MDFRSFAVGLLLIGAVYSIYGGYYEFKNMRKEAISNFSSIAFQSVPETLEKYLKSHSVPDLCADHLHNFSSDLMTKIEKEETCELE
jgi:hypothetical protein